MQQNRVGRRAGAIGLLGLGILASCFGGRPPSVPPSATLSVERAEGAKARSAAPFAVVHAGPRGEVTERAEPAVTVLFNRAMRTLDTAPEEGLPAFDVRTRGGEVLAGSWRWVGTHGALFTPDHALPASTEFQVTVPANAHPLDGTPLGADYHFEFHTPRPGVLEARPVETEWLRPDSSIVLTFNQAIEPAALEKVAHLVAIAPDGVTTPIPFHAHRQPAAPKEASKPEVVVVQPASPLPRDRALELRVPAGLRGEGPLAMEEPYTYAARTYGPLRLMDFRCDRIADKGRCRAHRDVTVKLSNPVAPNELRAHLRLGGAPAMKAPPGAKLPTDPAAEHLLRIDPDSGKRYKLTLTAGLRDVFGQRLERDTPFEIETEAPFLLPSGQPPRPDAAVAEAPRSSSPAPDPEDLRPRRPVLDYRVSVGLTGHVFEALASKGAHTIPVGTVNIPTYGMLAAALDEAQVRSWLGQPTASFLTAQSLAPTWFVPDAPENVRAVRGVNLDALLAPRKGYGAALVLLDVPGSGIAAQEMVSVTDLGVSARFSPYGSLVWVTHLSTGEPVARARVSAYVKDEEKVTVETDDQGLALLPGDRFDPMNRDSSYPAIRTDATLVVRAGDDWTFQRVERAAVDYRASGMFQDLSGRAHWAGLLFTERGVYRPGETMKLAGILRELDPAGLRAVEKDVHVEVTDGNGASVFDGRAPLDRFGSFTLDVPLPHTAHLGDEHVSATVRAGAARGEFSRDFKLLAYKAREFKVDVDADRSSLVRGDEGVFHVEASYLFGAPMPHAPVHVALTRERTPFTPPGTDGYTTSDDAYLAATRESESTGSALDDKDLELDESGRLTHDVRFDDPNQNAPERITFEAEVEDLTRQTVAQRTSVLVHPAEFYAAVRVPERLAAAGTRITPQVLAVEPSGAKRAGVAVQLELYERKWTTFVESQNSVPHRGWTSKDEVVGHCTTTTRATPSGCELLLREPGYFFVRATATDPRKHAVHVSTGFYAVPPGDASPPVVAWPDTDGRTVQLETNKAVYAVGDQARILLKSPFKQAKALVTVERDGVLSRSVVDVTGPMPVVTVPITPALYPNAYVSVHLVRGRVQATPESGPDLGAPDFRVGYAELKVDPEEHRLKVTIAPSRAPAAQPTAGKQAHAMDGASALRAARSTPVEYRPGETFEGDVAVADRQGRPVEGEVTFFAVDEGVLMLTGYATPDPLPPFVERRRLAVFTGESREGLARIHALKAGEKVPVLGWEYASRVNESGEAKGDEGGDGAGAAALRADFRTTAFFEAGKVTSHEGKAHYSFKLPDNLTTFRLMAVVAGKDDRFGFGELPIVTSRPLMARPALPRIVRVGDSFEASVVLSGKRLGATNVSVELAASGVTLTGPARKQAALPAGGSVEVRFPVKATAPGEASFEFRVNGAGSADRVLVKRSVELPISMETVAAYGETNAAAAVALADLSKARPDRGGLDVRVASTALVGLGTSLDRLVEYPYGCTEQLVSRTLPLVAIGSMKDLGLTPLPDAHGVVDSALEKILSHQKDDGGFGFWEDSPESEPWLSAYALFGLQAARAHGYAVPMDDQERATAYVKRLLEQAVGSDDDEDDDEHPTKKDAGADALRAESDKHALDFATATFAADALAGTSAVTPGTLHKLYDARHGKPVFARALLLHAMARSAMPTAELRAFAKELEAELRQTANDAVAPGEEGDAFASLLDSSARATALTLRALLAVEPKHPLASRLARGLVGLRVNGAWASTQDNAWALLALSDYRAAQEADRTSFDARVSLGDTEILRTTLQGGVDREGSASVPLASLVAGGPAPLTFESLGHGPLFYAAELRFAPNTLPSKPRDEGFFVQKLARTVPPAEIEDALRWIPKRTTASVTAGDLVLVDLLFESAEPRKQVVIDDPLPAGLEALDAAFETTSQSVTAAAARAQDDTDKKKTPPRPGELTGIGAAFGQVSFHREIHDDRVLTFIEDLPAGMYHFRYLARATSLGSFVTPPTRAECMYTPEVNGRTEASTFEVQAKK